MKKAISLTLFLLCIIQCASAQGMGIKNNTEKKIVFSAGPSWFFGDAGGALTMSDELMYTLQHTGALVSLAFEQQFYNRVGYRISTQYGHFFGEDIGTYKASRGHVFTTNMLQVSLLAEIVFLKGEISKERSWQFYGFAGGAFAYASVVNRRNSASEQTLQEKSFAIPVGLGYRFDLSAKVALGVELHSNYFLADNMDGLAPKSSNNNDFFNAALFTLSYRLDNSNRKKCMCESYD